MLNNEPDVYHIVGYFRKPLEAVAVHKAEDIKRYPNDILMNDLI